MHPIACALVAAATLVLSASAQSSASVAVTRFAATGNARDDDGTQIGPHTPRMLELAVAINRAGWRARVGGRYVEAGLAVSGVDGAVITPDMMSGRGAAIELQRRVAGDPAATALRLGIGIEAIRWSFAGTADDARWRLAPIGTASLNVGIAGRWQFLLRGEASAGQSLFDAEELPAGYRLRTGIRHGIGLGVERRW